MRRHLLLVRHAKSAWDDPDLADHDRPLASRGQKAVRRLRDHLERIDQEPEVVVCSSARRTIQTLDGIRAALPRHTTIEIDKAIYVATSDTMLSRLLRLDPGTRTAMMIGHNPGTQDLAVRLAGSGDARMLAQLANKLPTGAVVTLSFQGPWSDLTDGAARLDELFMPRPPRP